MRVTTALTLLLLVGTLAVPALAADLTASPSSGEPGAPIGVSGGGWTSGQTCSLHLNDGSVPTGPSGLVGTCTVDGSGALTANFDVPSQPPGSYTLWACNANGAGTPCDNPNTERASTPFQVITPPTTTTTTSTTTTTTPTTTTITSTTTSTTTVPPSSTTLPPTTTTAPRTTTTTRTTSTTSSTTTTTQVALLLPPPSLATTTTTTVPVLAPAPTAPSPLVDELKAAGPSVLGGGLALLVGVRLLGWMRSRRFRYGWFRRPTT